jgi:hypothetical protein
VSEWRTKLYADAFLAEYKIIRDEIVSTTTQFYSILQFGSTAVLALFGAAFSFWHKENLLVIALFGALIPTLSFVAIEMLLGQIARIRRAGQYCRTLEQSFHDFLQAGREAEPDAVNPPVGWETWLDGDSGGDRHFSWLYAFAVAFFFVISVASLMMYSLYVAVWPTIGRELFAMWTGERTADYRASIVALPYLVELLKTRVWLRQAQRIAQPLRLPGILGHN